MGRGAPPLSPAKDLTGFVRMIRMMLRGHRLPSGSPVVVVASAVSAPYAVIAPVHFFSRNSLPFLHSPYSSSSPSSSPPSRLSSSHFTRFKRTRIGQKIHTEYTLHTTRTPHSLHLPCSLLSSLLPSALFHCSPKVAYSSIRPRCWPSAMPCSALFCPAPFESPSLTSLKGVVATQGACVRQYSVKAGDTCNSIGAAQGASTYV